MRSDCPMCYDGIDLDTLGDCEVCNGLGFVTPGAICRCGRSASVETPEGAQFCGRDACRSKAA